MRYGLLLLALVPVMAHAEIVEVEAIVKKREAEVAKAYRELAETLADSNRRAIAELKARLPNAGSEEKKAIARVILTLNPADPDAKAIVGGKEPAPPPVFDLRSITAQFENFVDEQKRVTRDQLDALVKHESNINALETKMKYLDEKLKKLDELSQDELATKSDLVELKKAYLQLKPPSDAEKDKK